jgi:phosphoribosylaminoimidazole-succinocarboxamide synthase
MTNVITQTNYSFPGQKSLYKGKVRDVYNINDKYLVMVTSDRISAFDVVLPKGIPYKGQVLNQIAVKFLEATADICPNWKIASPDPSVTIGHFCKPFPLEMIIRGYLTGSSWRTYQKGARAICGVPIPDGMIEHQRFPEPIVTPTTKATEGHDEDISKEEILKSGLVSAEDYATLEKYTIALFKRGTEIAAKHGLILVDTKYEFGRAPTAGFTSSTRSIRPIHRATSTSKGTKSARPKACRSASSPRSSSASGSWNATSWVMPASRSPTCPTNSCSRSPTGTSNFTKTSQARSL